ncbi:tail spike protein [Caulobacter phage Sansa]|uniref:Tail spike protein n=1 Tax=Caulobacter phage Sansa TaxID=1675600 RepID=A0A0K1LLX2_9CAUD|nr:tail spike protein [Caulobacter phage Sansa]AKU43449.1 tail spike protein [Caulobacter phage Sansa]
MSLESEVAALTTATTALLGAVNVAKETLDGSVDEAAASAMAAASSETIAGNQRALAETARAGAELAQDAAEGLVATALAGAQDLGHRNAWAATNIPSIYNAVRTTGFYAHGDGGGALYKKVVAEPSHPLKFQSADGAWWEHAEFIVNVRAAGAKIDDLTDDTQAWKDALSVGRPVYHPGGVSRVSAQLVYGPFSIFGPPSNGRDTSSDRAIIKMMKGGVTPFASNYQINVLDVGISFGDTGTTPIDNLVYGKAYKVTGSIAVSGADIVLTVPAGGLIANTSVGSTVVVPADVSTKDFDYYANNYTDINSICIIKEIVSDTQAKLFAPAGMAVSSQSIYIRGNGYASVWTGSYQPSRVTIRRPFFSKVPGFGIVLTGAQQVDIDQVWGGGHLFAVGAFPESTQDRLNVGGTYHHVRINSVMNFEYSGGVILSSGLTDSYIKQCQADLNGPEASGAKNTYFASPKAQYVTYAAKDLEFKGNTAEDMNSPFGFFFYSCGYLDVDDLHGHDVVNTLVMYQACYNTKEGFIRATGTSAGLRTFTGANNTSSFELLSLAGGRDLAGQYLYRNGTHGNFSRFLNTRDFEIIKKTLPAATLKAHTGSQYDWNLNLADYGGYADTTVNIIENILFDHTSPWSSSGGTPVLRIGNSTDTTAVSGDLNLTQAAGYYMNGKNTAIRPIAMVAGAGGTGSLLIRIFSGGGIAMNNAGFVPQDLNVYYFVRRARV